MIDLSMEMDALDAIIIGANQLTKEALERKADIKQGRLASELMGRSNGALKIKLDYRLNMLRLIEMNAKVLESEKPKETTVAIEKQETPA